MTIRASEAIDTHNIYAASQTLEGPKIKVDSTPSKSQPTNESSIFYAPG